MSGYPNIRKRLSERCESKGWKEHAHDFQRQRDFARRVALATLQFMEGEPDEFDDVMDAFDTLDTLELECAVPSQKGESNGR